MATFTENTGLTKPNRGEFSGSWDTPINTNFDILDATIARRVSVNANASVNIDISDGSVSNGNSVFIETYQTLTANRTLNLPPNKSGFYFIDTSNQTKNSFSLSIRTQLGSTQEGLTVSAGGPSEFIVFNNGTETVRVAEGPKEGYNRFAVGMIMAFSGSAGAIPDGWSFCDGTNGTPDLRNRFIFGANSASATQTTGGDTTQTTGSTAASGTTGSSNPSPGTTGSSNPSPGTTGAHALTVDEIPAHTHSFNFSPSGGVIFDVLGQATDGTLTAGKVTNSTGGGQAHSHSIGSLAHTHTIGSLAHTHTFNDGGHTHSMTFTTPPVNYYILSYIMYTG